MLELSLMLENLSKEYPEFKVMVTYSGLYIATRQNSFLGNIYVNNIKKKLNKKTREILYNKAMTYLTNFYDELKIALGYYNEAERLDKINNIVTIDGIEYKLVTGYNWGRSFTLLTLEEKSKILELTPHSVDDDVKYGLEVYDVSLFSKYTVGKLTKIMLDVINTYKQQKEKVEEMKKTYNDIMEGIYSAFSH